MKFLPLAVLPLAYLLAVTAAPAPAAPGGRMATLPLGTWRCELPGDVTGDVGTPFPDADFRVLNASSYVHAKGRGIYLLTGDRVTMTSGPLRGWKFRRVSINFLRKIENGADSRLRCLRRVANNRVVVAGE